MRSCNRKLLGALIVVSLLFTFVPTTVGAKADEMVDSNKATGQTSSASVVEGQSLREDALGIAASASAENSAETAGNQEMGVASTAAAADASSHSDGKEPEGDLGDAVSLSGDGIVAQADNSNTPVVEYSGHVQNIGWKSYVSDGETAGTYGQSLRVEALKIRVKSMPEGISGGVQYRMHVQNIGWQDWVKDDAEGGTHGSSLRVEAMQVKLYGSLANSYDIWYRVHAQNAGWMGWTKNGDTAGTAGHAWRLEGVQIKILPKNSPAPVSKDQTTSQSFVGGKGVSVSAHVQNVGWMRAVGSGEVAGTTGRSLRMEAVSIGLDGIEVPGDIRVNAHVQNVGWKGWVGGGNVAGSVGSSQRVEALAMKLEGEASEKYDIWYRAHVANIGWMGWAHDGDNSGTSGMGTRIEAIQVVLVRDGAAGPNDPGTISEQYLTGGNVRYASSVQGRGRLPEVSNGAVSGTVGESRAMQAFSATYEGGTLGGGISYRGHFSNVGWKDWAQNGAETSAGGNAIEALQLALSGRAANIYDVWYRVHVADVGWLGWARNGEVAGSTGIGKAVQAVQVIISSKETPAPGSVANHAIDRSFFYDPMTRRAQGYGSRTPWLILVDCSLNRVGIYHGSAGNWQRTDLVTVSTGAYGTPTAKGVFSVNGRGFAFGSGYTCYYWTRFYGAYLFHSVIYYPGSYSIMDGSLGVNVSHGCVRMPIEKAKWIHDNIPDGTTVVTY